MFDAFDAFWKSGPWLKVKRKKAIRLFSETVRTDEDWQNIQTARDRYAEHLKANPWKNPMMGTTWLWEWEDWVEFSEPERPPTDAELKNHLHTAHCIEMGCPFDPMRRMS